METSQYPYQGLKKKLTLAKKYNTSEWIVLLVTSFTKGTIDNRAMNAQKENQNLKWSHVCLF